MAFQLEGFTYFIEKQHHERKQDSAGLFRRLGHLSYS
jgi:hypothetical protein